jgi:excisionase family DNA binding protein
VSATPLERLLSVEEAIACLGISRSKLHELVRAGEIRAVKIGRSVRFRATALQAFIEAHESGGKPAALKGRGKG